MKIIISYVDATNILKNHFSEKLDSDVEVDIGGVEVDIGGVEVSVTPDDILMPILRDDGCTSKIPAIRAVKTRFGFSFRDSKKIVEEFFEKHGELVHAENGHVWRKK